jgi:hypothetical protein
MTKLNTKIVRQLVSSGDIRLNTEIEATYSVADLSGLPVATSTGRFRVQTIKIINEIAYIHCLDPDSKTHKIIAENVLSIDGMDVSRFVNSSFNSNVQSSIITAPRKRGRPRKNAING